ncbi:MAG: hypothetical protein K6U74_19470 [Firmicutes bacterium]|nr:hypothetical protein [Bacillota bacterium]
MFVGLSYMSLSLVALAFWRLEPSCTSGVCSATDQIGFFLNRPWWLWGALFYAVAGALCLGMPKNRLTGAFLAFGALFHAGLIAYGYAESDFVCPTCWKFAMLGALLTVSYWFLPDKGVGAKRLAAAGSVLLAVAVAVILVTNPAVMEPGYAHDSVSDNPVLEDCQLCAHAKESGGNGATPGSGSVENLLDSQEKANVEVPAEEVKVPREAQGNKAMENAPKSAEENSGDRYLHVYTRDGKDVWLDLNERPALFFAVWCPHCTDALKDVAKVSPERRPYIVVAYLRDGDAEKAKEKLAENGLAGETYYLAENPPEGVQGVPALVWLDGSALRHAEGVGAIAEKLGAQ